MDELIPVEGRPGMYRDPSTNAIINKPSKTAAQSNRDMRQKIMQRDEDIDNLKQDVAEIKNLLKQLLER